MESEQQTGVPQLPGLPKSVYVRRLRVSAYRGDDVHSLVERFTEIVTRLGKQKGNAEFDRDVFYRALATVAGSLEATQAAITQAREAIERERAPQ